MKRPKYPYRIAILMVILTIPPIGATQLGWYLYDQQTGFDYGMIVGTFSVIYAAWLMYFGLVIPILGFVLYLGGTAIMNGFKAKSAIKENKDITSSDDSEIKLSDEIQKLNKLLNDGVLTQEEFEKAKKKILN